MARLRLPQCFRKSNLHDAHTNQTGVLRGWRSMTEKKPGEPKCYQYGPNPMVCAVHGHYMGCTVWREEIESRARREADKYWRATGKRVEDEIAEFGYPMEGEGDHHEMRDWLLDMWASGKRTGAREALERAAEVAALLDIGGPGTVQCSRECHASAARAIRALADQPEAEISLEDCDARNESFRKADTLPLGHEFVPYDKNRGPCELCHECIPPNGFFCHKPEAAHGRKPE